MKEPLDLDTSQTGKLELSKYQSIHINSLQH